MMLEMPVAYTRGIDPVRCLHAGQGSNVMECPLVALSKVD